MFLDEKHKLQKEAGFKGLPRHCKAFAVAEGNTWLIIERSRCPLGLYFQNVLHVLLNGSKTEEKNEVLFLVRRATQYCQQTLKNTPRQKTQWYSTALHMPWPWQGNTALAF